MSRLIKFFINNALFADLVSLFVIVIGVFSLTQIRRDAFPNISFDVITISTFYPGASAQEMEKLITNPIEQDLKEVDGIKKLDSSSTEGRSYVVVQLDPDQTTEQEAKDDMRSVIDRLTFPDDAEDPVIVAMETKQQPIIQVAISADIPEMELRDVAKKLEKKLENIKGVARINFVGLQDLEIRVAANPLKLREKSVALDEVISALKSQNVSIPGGTLDPDPKSQVKEEKIVRTIGEFKSPEDVASTVIRANDIGQAIRVGDIARVFYDLEEESVVNKSDGRKTIRLTVVKKEKADAINVVDSVRLAVAEFEKTNPAKGFAHQFIDDSSEYIRNRLSILTGNMLLGFFLVLITLTFFLPFRVSLVVAAGIALSFFGTMAFFHLNGFSLNMLSLLGIIIVSGMLVDDAIVVTDNIVRQMKSGKSPEEAALSGAVEIWPAVTASVLTTVVAFLPMMFMSGIFGKFVREIPLGVIVALIISLLESILILPQHVASYVRLKDFEVPSTPTGFTKVRLRFLNFWDNTVTPTYVRWVEYLVDRKYKTLGGAFVLLVTAVITAKVAMKFVLFPPEGVEIFFIRAQAQPGVTLKESTLLSEKIEKIVAQLPKDELKNYVTTIGLQQQQNGDPNTKRGPEYLQLVVYLTPENKRERVAQTIIDDLREKIGTPEGFVEVKFTRVQPGPPVGRAISLGVRGDNYEDILPAAEFLKSEVAKIPGIKDVEDSYNEGKPELLVMPLRAEVAAAGLTVAGIGTTVRAAVDGIIPTSIQRLDDEVNIRVSFEETNKTPSQLISQLLIPNRSGNLVPLTQVAKIEEAKGVISFDHSNNQREVKITADINTEINSSNEANKLIQQNLIPKMVSLFPNVQVAFGGEAEDTQESMQSLVRAFIVAFMAIFLILVFTFQNLIQPFIVVLTIPLGITSVIFSLMINGQPISFMAMLGIIALAGVIVNNAIILMDFVNQSRREGLGKKESILEAARVRLQPIFLTTSTTVMGLLPTAHGIGGLDKFVVPIAISLGYGLLFGSILTAFVFPAAISVLDDVENWFQKKFKKA
jgi:multidrug efflux pump subunit AcrB